MAAVLRAYSVWLVFFSCFWGGVWRGLLLHPEVLCSHIHTDSVGQSKHIPWEFIVVNYCIPKLSIIQCRLGSLGFSLTHASRFVTARHCCHTSDLWLGLAHWCLDLLCQETWVRKTTVINNAFCSGCTPSKRRIGSWVLQCECKRQMLSFEVSVWAKPHYTKNLNVDCVQ